MEPKCQEEVTLPKCWGKSSLQFGRTSMFYTEAENMQNWKQGWVRWCLYVTVINFYEHVPHYVSTWLWLRERRLIYQVLGSHRDNTEDNTWIDDQEKMENSGRMEQTIWNHPSEPVSWLVCWLVSSLLSISLRARWWLKIDQKERKGRFFFLLGGWRRGGGEFESHLNIFLCFRQHVTMSAVTVPTRVDSSAAAILRQANWWK